MLIECKLTRDDPHFGKAGTKVMINDGYIVGVTSHSSGSKVFVDLSDLEVFKTLYTNFEYKDWYILKLNP